MRKMICAILCVAFYWINTVPVLAAETMQPTDDTVVSQPTEHIHSFDELKSNTASCGTPGVATYLCSCGEEMQQDSEATGDHLFGTKEYDNTNCHSQICTVCGKEESEDHSWDSGRIVTQANCQQPGEQVFTCSGCSGTYIRQLAKTGHDYDPDISDDIYHICGTCGSRQSHAWNEGEVTKRPTCREAGTFAYHCSICDMTMVEILEKLTTHTYDSACDSDCNVCGEKRAIEHTFSTAWSKNYKGHWHECTKCGEQKDFAKHDPGPEATEEEEQVCLICKYVVTPKKNHVHSYEKQWSYDEVGHWYECTGCKNEKSYASHVFDSSCDPDCSVCTYERKDSHSFNESWQISNFEHWQLCLVCGEESPREKHIPGAEASEDTAQLCTVCSFELAPKTRHTHDFGTQWLQTDDVHWQECSCGQLSVSAPHIWDSGRDGKGGTVIYTCADCGLEKTVKTSASGISGVLLIIILLVLVCIGGTMAVAFIVRKKGSEESHIDSSDVDFYASENDRTDV